MSLAQLFFMKETFRESVRRWRQACFRQRSNSSPVTHHPSRLTSLASRFTLEMLEPRLLLSATPIEVVSPQETVLLEPSAVTVPAGALPSLDVDLNGQADALSDGILIIRHLFGFTGTALTNGAVDLAGQRTDPTAIQNYLTSISGALDVDLNQSADALSDGIIIMRSLFGFTGTALTSGAIDPAGQRTDLAAIAAFLDNMNPAREQVAPLLTAGLQQDTGLSTTDAITFNPTITGTIADLNQIDSFTAGFDGTPVGSFVDVLADLQATGVFTLSAARLAQIAGGTLPDGSHTLHLQATDAQGNVSSISDLVFTLDSAAPTVVSAPTGVLTEVVTSVTVAFSEAMSQAAFSAANYQLFVQGGTNDGQSVALQTVEQIDDHRARLTLANPLTTQGYRLTIGPTLNDRAGNALAPESTVSPFYVTVPTVRWINPTSGFWDVAANWSTGTVPGSTDDVLIDVPGDITVTHRSGITTVKSVVARDSLTFSGGTLIGATVLGSAVTVSPNASITLDGVTLAADLTVNTNTQVLVRNGLTLAAATVTLADLGGSTSGARLEFDGTQTLGGTGDVLFAGPSSVNYVRGITGTLTLGAGITIHGSTSGTVGTSGLALVNQGMIQADTATKTITVLGNLVTNTGTLQSANGGRLVVQTLDEQNSRPIAVAPGSSGTVNGQPVETSVSVILGSVQVQVTSATIMTHGFQLFDTGGDSLWSLANAIRLRADAENEATESAWLLDYDLVADGGGGIFDYDFGQDHSFLPGLSDVGRKGELVFLFDWAPESNQASIGWGEAAGDALFALLVDRGVINPTAGGNNIPLHFIGHSFGTAVTSEAIERLARFNVPVDQVTSLDPHDFDQGILPVDGAQRLFELGNPSGYGASVWSNVVFADAYYQTEFAPDGRPIPGAYNHLVNDEVFGTDAHSEVWSTFYLGTVQDPNSTTGYHYSRIANPGADALVLDVVRPDPVFYGLPSPNHQHSEEVLVNPTDGTPNATGLASIGLTSAQITQGRWTPDWDSLTIVNGDFEHRGEDNVFVPDWIPGWSNHKGGGTSDVYVDQTGTNHYLRLDSAQTYRIHNSLYVPTTASYLAFDLTRVSASADDVLAVRFGLSDPLVAISLVAVDSGFAPYVIPLPVGLRNQVDTLTFTLVQGGTGLEATVQIDNVKFLSALDGVPFAPSFLGNVRVELSSEDQLLPSGIGALNGATSPVPSPLSALVSLVAPSVGGDLLSPALSLPSEVVVEELDTMALTAASSSDLLTNLASFRLNPEFQEFAGRGMTAVVIDTGIDVDHPFFGPDADRNGVADRIVFQWDFADHDADASDRVGHGSHIASLIGSEDLTYPGVAPEADLIALKVFSDTGMGTFAFVEQALQWVVAHAAEYSIDVVNLSLGDGQNWTTPDSHYGLGDEFAALANDGIIVVAAAGNNFFTARSQPGVSYPAADPNVIGVGAVWTQDFGGPWRWSSGATDLTTGTDRIASFSQRDAAMTEIFAPGARLTGANQLGGTVTMQGTSQAAAYLSGTALLAQQMAEEEVGRKLTPQELTTLLTASGQRIVDGDNEQDNITNTGLTFPRVDMVALADAILALRPERHDNQCDEHSGRGEEQAFAHRSATGKQHAQGPMVSPPRSGENDHVEHPRADWDSLGNEPASLMLLAQSYTQQAWVRDFVGVDAIVTNVAEDEELLIALPG
jgi:hypothetical protein